MGSLGLGGSAVVSTHILHLELKLSLSKFWCSYRKKWLALSNRYMMEFGKHSINVLRINAFIGHLGVCKHSRNKFRNSGIEYKFNFTLPEKTCTKHRNQIFSNESKSLGGWNSSKLCSEIQFLPHKTHNEFTSRRQTCNFTSSKQSKFILKTILHVWVRYVNKMQKFI